MSEKPMTELLRRSGIIDKHIKEFEKWRLITDADEAKPAGKVIEDLVHDIAELLEKEPVMKQTLVAPVYTKTPPKLWSTEERSFYAVQDEMGRLIVDPKTQIFRGDTLWGQDDVHQNYWVQEVEDLYESDKVIAKMITIEKE